MNKLYFAKTESIDDSTKSIYLSIYMNTNRDKSNLSSFPLTDSSVWFQLKRFGTKYILLIMWLPERIKK